MSAQEATKNVDSVNETNQNAGDAKLPEDGSIVYLNFGVDSEGNPVKIPVSKTDTFQDLKQYVSDSIFGDTETCFSLKINDTIIPEFGQLGEIPDIGEEVKLDYVLEPYSEIEAKRHVSRVRELLSFVNNAATNGVLSYAAINAGQTAFLDVEELDVAQDKQADAVKQNPTTPEHFTTIPTLEELVPKDVPKSESAVHSLHFSQWNPPLPNHKTKGHILYLVAGTLEGDIHHIVCHSAGFYICKSTAHWFDPEPKVIDGKIFSEHSLFTLLAKASPKLLKAIERNATKGKNVFPQIYAGATNCFLNSPWLVKEPVNHADFARTQTDLVENVDLLSTGRDWNEEFQGARSMSKELIADRILRERLLNKISFEFSQAAVHGAISIINDCVQPLNPFDEPEARIYLQDNIFYSFATDPSEIFSEFGGKEAAHYASAKDVQNINFVNKLDTEDVNTVLTAVVDYAGHRITAQAPVPGIFRNIPDEETQVRYGTVENLQSIKTDEKYVEPFTSIAKEFHIKKHEFFDKEGNAATLVTPVTVNGVDGTDRRKYILDLQRLTPLDLAFLDSVSKDSENPYPHTLPLLRKELVDYWFRTNANELYQGKLEKRKAETAKDEEPAKPKEEKKDGEEKKSDEEKKEGESEEAVEEEKPEPSFEELFTLDEQKAMIEEATSKFHVNPDVPYDLASIPEKHRKAYEEDAKVVREVSSLITEKVIPALINDVKNLLTNTPIDGQQLTDVLHRRGINMRYLGAIAKAASEAGPMLKAFEEIAVAEAVTRAAKRVLNSYLTLYPTEASAYIIAHFFNCFLGTKINAAPKLEFTEGFKLLYSTYDFAPLEESMTAENIQASIAAQVNSRFRLELPSDWIKTINSRYIFRALSIKIGIQWKARSYDFEATEPYYEYTDILDAPYGIHTELSTEGAPVSTSTNKKKKAKKTAQKAVDNAVTAATQPAQCKVKTLFSHNDMLNIVPVIRHSTWKSHLAEEALEAGRLALLKQDKEQGLIMMTESAALHEQIYGSIHKEVAHAFVQLSLVYNEMKNHELACSYGRKALIIQERCTGIDSAETIIVYLNLALFEYSNDNAAGALNLIKHALKYWLAISGKPHPDSLTTMNNASNMLQSLKQLDLARAIQEATLPIIDQLFGKDSVYAAPHHFSIANLLVASDDYKGALASLEKAHAIYQKEYGDENVSTVECKRWLDGITDLVEKTSGQHVEQQAVNGQASSTDSAKAALLNAAAKFNQRRSNGSSSRKTGSFQNAAAKESAAAPSALQRKGDLSIDELVKYINGADESVKKNTDKQGSANTKKNHKGGKKHKK